MFEHQTIKLNQEINEIIFDESKLKALQNYYGDAGCPYYTLTNNGVRFNEHVGVIQVGDLMIEVLPKADKKPITDNEKTKWRSILIDMVRSVSNFEIKTTSNSQLRIKPNTILDLYFEIFINEVEYLFHSGLVKRYRKKESNVTSLKGSLQFGKHIQQNLIHQERFFVRHTIYDVEHPLQIPVTSGHPF